MKTSKGWLVYRKSSGAFFSIENVFNTLLPYLGQIEKVELPHSSSGLIGRIKNILYLYKYRKEMVHISGHDHYLLWYPFKKSILTIHDIESLNRKRGIKRWLFKKLWFDIPIKNARQITTISNFTKLELLRINNYKTPIEVIPNPLTVSAVFNAKYIWSNKLRVLHIGTKENKNLIRLVKALRGIDCELIIIGKITAAQSQALKENKTRFQNLNNLSEEELMRQYELCDLLAFVSTYEGFGLPIIEAQSIGRLVLTSNVSSMPEVAGKGAYFVDPYSVQNIRNGIEKMQEDINLRKELLDHGRENVKRFDVSTIADKYAKLYDQLI